jgi:hypothetical protein
MTDVYEDNGVSGTIPVHERPEGRRLIEEAKGGGFGAVLVYRLDRLGRSLLVIVDAHDRLEEAGVAMRSGTEPIDTSNPSGRLIFQMLASFAEFERASIRERTQAGLHRALRNGKQLGMIHVRAEWLEELVWSDVWSFLKNPGKVLERVRAELAEDSESEDLEERHASLARRLAAKETEKGRYVKLFAQGYLDEEELEVHLVDLKNQVENLKLLIDSVEADIGRKEENKLTAQTTEAWLLTLRERIEEVEEDTGEALEKRRELVKLLVEQIKVNRNEDGHTQVQITYRFGPLPEEPENVHGVQHSVL